MKRSIYSLVNKIGKADTGEIIGGFGALKGGVKQLPSINDSCTNTTWCDGTNVTTCTNGSDCSLSTNKNGGCTNNGTCFA